MLIALVGLFACGEATDQREDCRDGEYFDEANESCEACPAIPEPNCRPGCGFHIVEDERGCPVAECGLTGAATTDDGGATQCRCPAGEFFDDDSLTCVSCDSVSDPPAICDDLADDS